MNQAGTAPHPDFRPWYREPWVWVLIAFPTAAVIGCAITIWLALSNPDYLVVDEQQYQQIESELEASRPNSEVPTAASEAPGIPQQDGDG